MCKLWGGIVSLCFSTRCLKCGEEISFHVLGDFYKHNPTIEEYKKYDEMRDKQEKDIREKEKYCPKCKEVEDKKQGGIDE